MRRVMGRENGEQVLLQEYLSEQNRAPKYAARRIESASARPTTARQSGRTVIP
jgi:hypothetical protein